jgi:septal ring-binding cell division protein DamX
LASQTHDDGFHEIQLNGKQLVFLFMAATVVSVVIFLCGVLVGRGVRAERTAAADAASMSEPPLADPAPLAPPTSAQTSGSADPTAAPPPTATEDLSYFNRLEKSNPPVENLKPSAQAATGTSASIGTPSAQPAVKEPSSAASQQFPPSAGAPSPGSGYAVQVAALNVRSEADAIAKRLSAKGYAAYVQTPPNGTASVFRVRIGTFKTRHEAETVAAKLQKEEQFKPWVTK